MSPSTETNVKSRRPRWMAVLFVFLVETGRVELHGKHRNGHKHKVPVVFIELGDQIDNRLANKLMKLVLIEHPTEKRRIIGYLTLLASNQIETEIVDPDSAHAIELILRTPIETPYGTFESSDASNWMKLAPDWLGGDYLSIEEIAE